MNLESLRATLARVASGELSPDDATEELARLAPPDLEVAMLDIQRQSRTGQPEVVYGPGKTPEQLQAIVLGLDRAGVRPLLVTRVAEAQVAAIRQVVPEAVHHPDASLVVVRADRSQEAGTAGTVAVVSAGTSDLPVAEEAAVVAGSFGLSVERIHDVGVAGIHRILANRAALEAADCVIVVAGMEGALASVVAGLVRGTVIAVPTSVGYGASFGGLTALLAMLSSCVPGVVVVGVDNGLGAAMAAHRIVRR